MIKKVSLLTFSLLTAINANAQPEWKLSEKDTLGFDGYFRYGIGQSEHGERQVGFGLPGATAKYRLGNEPDYNAELALDYRHYLDGIDDNNRYIQLYYMRDGYLPHDSSEKFKFDRVAQAYVKFANFLDEGVDVWFGRRYYDRKDIHINDHFWLNTGQNAGSGYGGGIEGIKINPGVLDVFVLRSSDESANDTKSTHIDFRLRDLDTNNNGKLTLWAMASDRPSTDYNVGATPVDLKGESGYGLGFWHDQALFDGKGSNTFAVIYRDGAAVPRGSFNNDPLLNNPAVKDVNFFEINNQLLVEASPDWAFSWAAVYRDTDQKNTDGTNTNVEWFSTGVRPIYYLTDHLNLAFELGYDHVDNNQTNQSGGLTKATVALQIAKSRGFFSRPVVRVFGTFATWDSDFKGAVGGTTYANETNGHTFGVQAEWWW
jgi:maltoporin